MAKVLIVDDDLHIRELVKLLLTNEGFDIYEAIDGIDAQKQLERIQVDLVVLDIMMPNMDGWELCQEIRKFYDIPLLMLTAKRETSEKLKGFAMGTDDYLAKPFEPLELVARVKALLKRYQISISQIVKVGNVILNRKTYEVQVQNVDVSLPLKEFELLFLLSSYPGKTFTREQLIEKIWGYDYEGDERTVDVHVKRLRSRFESERVGFQIQTVRGLGYRLEENGS